MTDIYQFGLRKTGSLHRLGSGHYLRKIEFVWTCPGAVKTLARVNYQEAWNVPEIADKTDGQVPQVTLDISFHDTKLLLAAVYQYRWSSSILCFYYIIQFRG